MPYRLIYCLIFLALIYLWWQQPAQEVEVTADGSYRYPDYQFKRLQPFSITGRVLSRKNYRTGREAELSSLDLAMGWGVMAHPETLEHFEISQRNRWYFWQADSLPIPRRQVETHSANIHIIFANETVAQAADEINVDDMVTLEGDLIEVIAEDGWRWRSSLTRQDTGNGSCELLLLTHIEPV